MNEDPQARRERKFDTVTFVLACILSTVILGAIGYGVLNSSKVATIVPSLSAGTQIPGPPDRPMITTGTH